MRTRYPLHYYIACAATLPFFLPICVAIVNQAGPAWLYVGIGFVWAVLAGVAGYMSVVTRESEAQGTVSLSDVELLKARSLKSFCSQSFGLLVFLIFFSAIRGNLTF